jgi:hypothetical protein
MSKYRELGGKETVASFSLALFHPSKHYIIFFIVLILLLLPFKSLM